MNPNTIAKIQEFYSSDLLSCDTYRGEITVRVTPEVIFNFCQFLRDDESFQMQMLIDLTAVDYLDSKRIPRFDIVYHFHSLKFQHRLRVKVGVSEHDCQIQSISPLWACANWYERECYDMYGITFKDHPNLERILMYDGFEGYPLRKDYPVGKQQPLVDLKPVAERYTYQEDQY